jgi:Ca2+/Na+ antiporter
MTSKRTLWATLPAPLLGLIFMFGLLWDWRLALWQMLLVFLASLFASFMALMNHLLELRVDEELNEVSESIDRMIAHLRGEEVQ